MDASNTAFSRSLIVFWLVLLLAAGTYVRVHGVDSYYYSLDELSNVAIEEGHTAQEVTSFSKFETHPPYPHILRHYLLDISNAPWFSRFISAVFGLGCILVYYALGKQLGGPLAGSIAAGLVTFGYGNIILSQVVRNYTLLALFLGLAFYCHRFFLRSGSLKYLWGYLIAGLLAQMTHYSTVFMLFPMNVVGLVLLWKEGRVSRKLVYWMAANAVLLLYFGYTYMTEIRHNAYESMFVMNEKTATESPLYGSIGFRVALIVAYAPALASYFLHSNFSAQLNIPSALLFLWAMTWLYFHNRTFFYEALLAMALGAGLLAADIYPYAFRIAGRHATWALPYVILPVSLFLAHAQRWAKPRIPGAIRASKGAAVATVTAAALAGIAINPSTLFFNDLREYQLSNAQMQQLRTFLASLTPQDAILATGLNTLYVLPSDVNFYRIMLNADRSAWYYSTHADAARLLFTRQYPIIADNHIVSLHDFFARLLRDGQLKGITRIWYFSTDFSSDQVLASCSDFPKQTLAFTQAVSTGNSGVPVAEIVGLPLEILINDVLPANGKYSHCL